MIAQRYHQRCMRKGCRQAADGWVLLMGWQFFFCALHFPRVGNGSKRF